MSTWLAEVLEGQGKEYDGRESDDRQALVNNRERCTRFLAGTEGGVCKGERTMRLWSATKAFYMEGKPYRCVLDDATQEMTDCTRKERSSALTGSLQSKQR